MTTRREFCGQSLRFGTAMAAAAILGSRSATSQEASKPPTGPDEVSTWMAKAGGPRGWRIAAGLNGFQSSAAHFKKDHYPLWEVLSFCRSDGFEGIELVPGWPEGAYPSPDDSRRVEALRELYRRYDLKIHAIQPDAPGRPFSENESERKAWLQAYRTQIRLAKRLGCDLIGQWPGGPLGNQTIDQAIDHCISSYREAAKMCADEGLWMSFEIEPPFVFNTLDHLKRILEGVNHPACRTNFDPSHFDLMSGGKGRSGEFLKALGVKHIGHVHLTDCDGTLFGGTSKHLPCGDGHCDIHASLLMLWEGGYRGWIMIDGWLTPDVYDSCHKGKLAIEKAMAEAGRGKPQ